MTQAGTQAKGGEAVRFRVSSTLGRNGKPLHGSTHDSLPRRYLHIETADGLATLGGYLTAEEFAYVMQALKVAS